MSYIHGFPYYLFMDCPVPDWLADLAAARPAHPLYGARDRARRWWEALTRIDAGDDLTIEALDALRAGATDDRWLGDLLDDLTDMGPRAAGWARALADGKHWRVVGAGERGRDVRVLPIWAPALADDAPATEAARYPYVCIDLLALDPQRPEAFRLRRDMIGFLGETALWAALDEQAPLRVHRYPLAWLDAGGRIADGCCVLNWRDHLAEWLLTDVVALIADDEAHAEELYKRSRRPKRLPEIRFVAPAERAA